MPPEPPATRPPSRHDAAERLHAERLHAEPPHADAPEPPAPAPAAAQPGEPGIPPRPAPAPPADTVPVLAATAQAEAAAVPPAAAVPDRSTALPRGIPADAPGVAPGDAGMDTPPDTPADTGTTDPGPTHDGSLTGIEPDPADTNHAPVILGGPHRVLTVAEATGNAFHTPEATDAEGDLLTWRVTGGADAWRVLMDPATGALRFLVAPDFEAPGDADRDNVLEVEVAISDPFGATGTQRLTIRITDLAEPLRGTAGNDELDGDGTADTLLGLAGADTLRGGAGDDLFVATPGDGDDSLSGGEGAGDLYSLAGTDAPATVHLGQGRAGSAETGQDTLREIEGVEGGAGADRLTGSAAANLLRGGAGDDTLAGLAGADTLAGGAGHDRLLGGAGADLLAGEEGRDTLVGGDGADTLSGGAGRDRLDGGAGADLMLLRSPLDGPDTLVGFAPGEDRIAILGEAFGLAPGADLLALGRYAESEAGTATAAPGTGQCSPSRAARCCCAGIQTGWATPRPWCWPACPAPPPGPPPTCLWCS
jgi:hypothetical protein